LRPRSVGDQVDAVVLAAADQVAGRLRRRRLTRRLVLVTGWLVSGAAAAVLLILVLGRPPRPAPEARVLPVASSEANTETTSAGSTGEGAVRDGMTQAVSLPPEPPSSPVVASWPTEAALMARTLRLELEVARLQRLARRAGDKPGYRAQLDLLETTLETIETRLIDPLPPSPQPAAHPAPPEPKEDTGHDDTKMLLPGPHRDRIGPAGGQLGSGSVS
jgi:hypothetical protein